MPISCQQCCHVDWDCDSPDRGPRLAQLETGGTVRGDELGVTVNTPTTPGAAGGRRDCVYLRGGSVHCTVHGPGAKRRWRPATRSTSGRRGRWDGTREYYWECDLGQEGR